MVWFTSKDNGNVFEVHDSDLARQFEADGHEKHGSDPRVAKVTKPKPAESK